MINIYYSRSFNAMKGGTPRQRAIRLTKFELMDILWELGEASIRQVQDAIQERKRPAYTTIQTIIARLEGKGALRRAYRRCI